MAEQVQYTEDNIRSLDWKEHIRMRPGMYIGKLGDGKDADDGIYVLLKEVVDNSIDEYTMGHGRTIEVAIKDDEVRVRDYGRGIPLGKVVDCVSKINTGGKYDSRAFKKSVGLNGVGTKAVNALSTEFVVESVREGQLKRAGFVLGELADDAKVESTTKRNGTRIRFKPDPEIFKAYRFRTEHVEKLLWNYAYLNTGLTLYLNGEKFRSEHGLKDLLEDRLDSKLRYPIVHLSGEDIEVAITHTDAYGEDYQSFVNGQFTPQGGTHQAAFREAYIRVVRDFFGKDYDAQDIRGGISAAVAVKVEEPVFESQTKTKLQEWHAMVDVNVTGVLNTLHATLPLLLASKGHVINIGSLAARQVFPNSGIYCATKHAVLAISESLRTEFKGRLAVTTLNPGAVNTPFIDRTTNDDLRANYRPQFDVGMSPEYVAKAALFAVESRGKGIVSELTIRPDTRN